MDTARYSPALGANREKPVSQKTPTKTAVAEPSILQQLTQESKIAIAAEQTDRPLTATEQVSNALLLHPSTTVLCTLGVLGYGIKNIIEVLNKKDVVKKMAVVEQKQIRKKALIKALKEVLLGGGVGILAGVGLSLLTTLFYTPQASATAHSLLDEFNKKKGIDSKLIILPVAFNPPSMTAETDSFSGDLVLSPLLVQDFLWSKWLMKSVITHELKHLDQFILMGCSPNDGLRRLNFLSAKKMVEGLKKSPEAIEAIIQAHTEIEQGLSFEQQQQRMAFKSYSIPTKDFVETCYTLLSNKQATAYDIPIILNVPFYEKASKKHGRLTPQEVQKAEAYFKAWETYPTNSIGSKIYRQNTLEKEAFDTMPWYSRWA